MLNKQGQKSYTPGHNGPGKRRKNVQNIEQTNVVFQSVQGKKCRSVKHL